MARDNLLKEAIADAKAVREAAIANAMLTLKESFKPQLTSMLATRLRNEEEGVTEGDEVIEQKKLSSSDIGTGITVDNPGPKKPSAASSSSSDIENPGQEVDTFGEGIEGMGGNDEEDDDDQGPEVNINVDADEHEPGSTAGGAELGGNPDGEAPEMGAEPEMGDDDLDLEAIIRELEADLMGGQEEPTGLAHDDGGVPFGSSKTKTEDWQTANAGMYSGQDKDLEEGSAEGVEKNGKDMKAVDGVPGGKEVKAGQEVTGEAAEIDEEVDLEEILREMEADESADVAVSEKIATENAELKRSIREHREVIKLLRSRVNEVTLLNSKLMYTTRIFRTFNLSESQKKKVVEQFDRATTLREAKLIYGTLAESLIGKVGSATPRKVAANITEGASKPTASTKPKSQTVLTEGNTQVARMQKLAGIVRS